MDVRTLGWAEPVPDTALCFEPHEQIVDAVCHPARLDALRGAGVPQTKRKVDRAAARSVGELHAVLFALAHGMAVLEALPGVAFQGVGQVAVVVRVVLLVGRHVVPSGDLCADSAAHELAKDIAVAK